MSQSGNARTNARSSLSTQAVSTSTRVPASNHLSVPQIVRSASDESQLLKTPSSLAQSVLLNPVSSTPTPIPSQTPSDSHRKDNLVIRSQSKMTDPDLQLYEVWDRPMSTKPLERNETRFKEHPEQFPRSSGEKTSAPINVPIQSSSGRKSPEEKFFTPFRLCASRRHRTISAASLDATDGTAVSSALFYVMTID
jgi:hypothetical protein